MKTIKNIVATLLSAAIIANAAIVLPAQSVSAEITQETYSTLSDIIRNSLYNFDNQIDITSYDVLVDDFQTLNNALNEVLCEPEMFFVNISKSSCGAGYDDQGRFILTSIKFTYANELEPSQQYVKQLRDKADEIISRTITDGMTDLEKALKLHDYLVLNSYYDVEGKKENLNGGSSAYDIIVDGSGICQGYAQAYKYLLQKVGINAAVVSSTDMVHAWNLVEIDGQWYHVDVTWDDPVPDTAGRVSHSYFMLSDQAIQTTSDVRTVSHYNWDSNGITAQSTKYDNEFWAYVNTEMFISGSKWYFIDKDGVYSTYDTLDQTVSTNVIIDDEKWMVWGSTNEYWSGKYTSLIVSGGTVYYNTPTMIYSMNMDGSYKQAVSYVNPYDTDGYVYGMVIQDGILYAVIKQSPKDSEKLYKVTELKLDNYSYMKTVLASIADLQDGESSVFDMASQQTTILPAEALDMIRGRNIQLMFDFEEYSWNINGKNVTASQAQDLNLEIDKNAGVIPQELAEKTADGNQYFEINLMHSGQFGLTATVRYYVGSQYAGQNAVLYYYNKDNATMDRINEILVDENGFISTDLYHASTYMAVIENKITSAGTVYGDLDLNGEIDMSDMTLISQYLIGDIQLSEQALENADVTFDGEVSLADLSTMKQYVIKDIVAFKKL
ncbi:MAG: transglutaminase domain-containing protein [Oscillospiraceae bacterium]|nr:transglutaminase domain-containing protein [Oscillospiraceae bacterium]